MKTNDNQPGDAQAPGSAQPHVDQTISMTPAAATAMGAPTVLNQAPGMPPAGASTQKIYNQQPPVAIPPGALAQGPVQQTPVVSKSVARRKFMGKSLAGLAVAGGVVTLGGVALGEWLSHGGLNNTTSGSAGSEVQIGHLLRRAGFGANASELDMYRKLGYQGAVDRLLNYQKVDDSAMEKSLQALNLNMSAPQDQQRWWLLRMAWTQRPLLEKMTLFWSGVLTSSFRKVGGPRAYIRMLNQNNFLRTHAFDTFDTILLGITADPAMLFYLDLTKSTKAHPNENYARELMELFTVGIQNYTQQDVFAGAAALTGWHLKGVDSSVYNPADHSTLPVRFMGQTGSFDYKDIVRILANHPATPWFIGRHLFSFFVHENPSNDDLKPLVDAYVQSGHNMGAVMRALLLSPQFSSAQAYRSRIKSPVEFTVGAYRALGLQGDGQGLPAITTLMGQPLFDPPDVSGWPGDKLSSSWLNSGAWMTRLNYIDLLLVRGTVTKATQSPIDLQGMINANKLTSPETFVDHFAGFMLDGPLPTERRTQVLDYFSATDNASKAQITLSGGKAYPLNRVRGALYLLMSSPEYQLN
ncbi:MAG TPA: DUF1800 domain-containing protein [Ktedonobacteraceae bacterium]